jgi:hypothetical protein
MAQNTGGQNTTNQGSQGSQQAQGSQQQQQSGSQSAYWKQQFQNEPYYQQGRQFSDYEQAYNTGEQGRNQYGSSGQSFEQSESNLRGDYENSTKGASGALKWDEGGKQACKAAWDRAGSQSSDRDMQSGSTSASSQTGASNTKRQ